MSSTAMATIQRLIVTIHHALPSVRTALLAGTATLTLAVSACSPVDTSVDINISQRKGTATAAEKTSAAEFRVYVKDGVAIGGADPVAYFTQATFVPGSPVHVHEWQGVDWHFASTENRDQFATNPEQYAPQYGGYCAWAVAARNTLVPIDPTAWNIVEGKLYLNANKNVQRSWERDEPGFISQADLNWPSLSRP